VSPEPKYIVKLTKREISILLSITEPRSAFPGDWSVGVQKALERALKEGL
jgi:hypothetical protein